jgi:hypothetical protein
MAIGGKARFKVLLNGFNRIHAAGSSDLMRITGRLLEGFKTNHERGRRLQKTTADDFNLLDTLEISSEEARHSMMLAWLLNREATHAQGNLGFQLFLEHVGLDREYAEKSYGIVREKSGVESRVDVEVAAPGEFIIHIENKIYSDEGNDQIKREWRDLLRRARGLRVKQQNAHGFFLTLDRHAPASPEFQAISWQEIADVLDEFSERSKADQVGLFAAHYAQALRRMTFEVTQIYEDENQARPES